MRLMSRRGRGGKREDAAAKRPSRGPKGRAWRVKAERSEAFTSQQTCKR